MRGLRERLRAGTREQHARLDESLSTLDLQSTEGYVAFLRIQHAARLGIERWLATYAETPPPAQTALIERDLADLGQGALTDAPEFRADRQGWLGVSYVIAGSHLGNRTLVRSLDPEAPRRFMDDPAMPAYWRGLQATMNAAGDRSAAAISGAAAAFDHFARCAEQVMGAAR